jgi:Lon protease-like protein
MTENIALFPLQLVVFPGETLNLHIFEPRYRQLIEDAEQQGITFCVPTVINRKIRPIATEVELTEVAMRYPGGESDIHCLGKRIFHLEEVWKNFPDKLYPGGNGRLLTVDLEEDPGINEEIIAITVEIYRLLNIDKTIKSTAEGFRTYDISHYVGMTLEQEYELLSLRGSTERQRYLLNHLKTISPSIERKTAIRDRAKLNGHFQELTPPEW